MQPECSIDRCCKPAKSRGWCSAHYELWRKHGDPEGGRVYGDGDRFLSEVAIPFQGDECLIWQFAKNARGYGVIWLDLKTKAVHRVVCEAVRGPAPSPSHEAAHSCGNGSGGCCNPRHLRWSTRLENEADKIGHGTVVRGEKQWNSKLTEEDVREIRRLSRETSGRAIAKRFGVTAANISSIILGKTWGHVK